MCSKNDFCDWNDINLDELFGGDYTDDDAINDSSNSSDSSTYEDEIEKPNRNSSRPTVGKRGNDAEYVFDCPVCRKILRSVTGFRGHVIKQHSSINRSDFKVADYRRRRDTTGVCSSSIDSPASEATAEVGKSTTLSLTDTDFHNLFIANTLKVWHSVSVNPMFSLSQSKHGAVVTGIAKCMIEKSDTISNFSVFEDKLRSAFVNRPLITQSDKDLLITSVHALRVSLEVQGAFMEYISTQVPHVESDSCQFIFQIWLRQFVAEMMISIAHICKPIDDGQVSPKGLSDTDQNVLYHICGYMIMKLKAVSFRLKKLKSAELIVNCVSSKVPTHSGHFVEAYTAWVSKQSRGGLLYPIPDFYLLVREFDHVYRQLVTAQQLTSKSLNKSNLQLAVHDSFMVKYYWSRILGMACCDEHSGLPALDYLIRLFLTIKGFAVARKERDSCLVEDGKMKRKINKSSQSLRGKLKGVK